jgi:anthranilate phosphoribosyltransferase
VSALTYALKALHSPEGLPSDFDPADAWHACSAILDGGVNDFELGALITGLARHARAPAVLLGLRDAILERSHKLDAGKFAGVSRPVILPNYGSTQDGRLAASALPLIVLLLQRFGVPVLLHGAFETSGGLAVTALLRDFGVLPCATRAQAQKVLDAGGVALLPVTLMSPGLAALMSLRARIGQNTPAHVLAPMLMPVRGPALQVCQACDIDDDLVDMCIDEEGETLVAQSGESSPFGSPLQRPRLTLRCEGRREALFDADSARHVPVLSGAHAIAEWTRAALDGNVPLPALVVNQLACCLYGSRYVSDFNQAKAIAALETGALAAANTPASAAA